MLKLDFLNEILSRDENKLHKSFTFMQSEFEDNIWAFKFKKTIFKINFNVLLSDNLLLTNKNHLKKLNTLKQLIVYSIYENQGYLQDERTIIAKVNTVLKIFDYINFKDNDQQFSNLGFRFIDSDYLINMLNIFSSSNYDLDSFRFNELLLDFYNKNLNNNNIKPISIELLDIEELYKIYSYFQNNKISLSILYPNFIRNITGSPFPIFFEDVKSRADNYVREYSSYFRQQKNTKLSEVTFSKYKFALNNFLSLIKDYKNDNSYSLIDEQELCKALGYSHNISLVDRKRFETYPVESVIKMLGKAIDFHINYGDKIVFNYIESINKNEINKNIFKKLYSRKLLKETRNDYISRLRNHDSLYHSLKIYYGCVQFVVGAIMARRRTELCNLKALECIDEHGKYLIFKRAKSSKNTFGLRDKIKLPIDDLCIEMIKNLQKIHIACDSDGYLFSMPLNNKFDQISVNELTKASYDEKLDMLFDYLEAPVIDGKRMYIRQHQLRRFFAMAFFWKGGFGSLDTLRWFLAHMDISHVYNYITETVPGEVLKEVKAQYVTKNIDQYQSLKELIIKKFNTENFDLLDTETLNEYVESLVDDKTVSIEPEFLTDNNNNKYNIVVSIKE